MQKVLMCVAIVLHLIFPGSPFEWDSHIMRWVDHLEQDNYNMDIFFDRVVMFVQEIFDKNAFDEEHTYMTPGVLVTSQFVLTSYNPFRKLMTHKNTRDQMRVAILLERTITDWTNVSYNVLFAEIEYARPIIPVMKDLEIWHGRDEMHSPAHDLMIVKIKNNTEYRELDPDPKLYSFEYYDKSGVSKKDAGALITTLANKKDMLGNDLKFASLGFRNDKHIWQSCFLYQHEVTEDEITVYDCDSWIPREWGNFICIGNKKGYTGVGSGAILIHDNKLFGIGSFYLYKSNESILVFTDVRPYHQLILRTASRGDRKPFLPPDPTTTTTTTEKTIITSTTGKP